MKDSINVNQARLLGGSTNASLLDTDLFESDQVIDFTQNGNSNMFFYNLTQEIRTEIEELKKKYGDGLYAVLKESGFEEKLQNNLFNAAKRIEGRIRKQVNEVLKKIKEDIQKEREDLLKEIEKQRKWLQENRNTMERIKQIATELEYQLDIENKPF